MDSPFRTTTIYKIVDKTVDNTPGKTLIEYTKKEYFYSNKTQLLLDGVIMNARLVIKKGTFWR